jgi:hypothetical protein
MSRAWKVTFVNGHRDCILYWHCPDWLAVRWQLKDSINEMAEENAEELLEVGEDQMDAMAETGLDSSEMTVLGLGGAVAGVATYQGHKALVAFGSDTCGNSEHIPHVAYVKLKLTVCFQFLTFCPSLSTTCIHVHFWLLNSDAIFGVF